MYHPALLTIEDTLGDAIHCRLDDAVNAEKDIVCIKDVKSLPDFSFAPLLRFIIKHSEGRLFCPADTTDDLITKNPALKDKLQEAWNTKKYHSIRLLEFLQKRAPDDAPSGDPDERILSDAFLVEYRGAAADGFYEYLTNNETLFRTEVDPQYYAKFCSIIQSSGTGKSRMMTELGRKNVLVLYMSLHEMIDPPGFPSRDLIPWRILTNFSNTPDIYNRICQAFFAAIFEALVDHLSVCLTMEHPDRDKVIRDWNDAMCTMDASHASVRQEFFSKVEEKYRVLYSQISVKEPHAPPKVPPASDADQVAENLKFLSVTGAHHKEVQQLQKHSSCPVLTDAHEKLGACLDKIFGATGAFSSNQPRLVIAMDEAHILCQSRGLEGHIYRPADVLCRVINDYSHAPCIQAIWVVFASTTSKVADFSPPNQKHNSARVIRGEKLFSPYTQLGWDQYAPALGVIAAEDISKIGHILKYGRPLWLSIKKVYKNPENLLLAAASKLCGMSSFNASNEGQVVAVLGQRFGLDITLGHPESIDLLETAVASHLRICLSTTLDRSWRYTSYPSEPLLSCAAASRLHFQPDNLKIALKTLENRIRKGMINIGERGELTSRLLWLLAKDLYVLEKFPHSIGGLVTVNEPSNTDAWELELLHCKMIPVVDWLEFVFGERVWEKADSRESFKDAYLNFSHWVPMDANLSGAGNELRLEDCTLRHWQRTSAVQCCHEQPRVDKMIPIYFKDAKNRVPKPDRMSQIFISDKDRQSSSKTTLNTITRTHSSLGGYAATKDRANVPNHPPYIAILADLGLSSKFEVTFPERNTVDRCLRIYAAGTDAATYPFLEKHPDLLAALRHLVSLQKMPENTQRYGRYLDAQVKFGKTATAQHMIWEQGSRIPELPIPSSSEQV